MRPRPARPPAWATVSALAASLGGAGCSASSAQPLPIPPATTCGAGPAVFDGGSVDYSVELPPARACTRPAVDTGTTAPAGMCARALTCAPACCVCPAGTALAGKPILLAACADGLCEGAQAACCSSFLYGQCNPAATNAGPG